MSAIISILSKGGTSVPQPSYVSGQYYGIDVNGTTFVDRTLAANEAIFTCFSPHEDITIDRLGINVRAVALGTLARLYIIDSDVNRQPNAIVYTSATIDITSTGHKEIILDYTFKKSKLYWLMYQVNGTASLECVGGGGCPALGLSSVGATKFISLRNTPAGFPVLTTLTSFQPYGTSRSVNTPAQVKFRKA